MNGEPLLTVRLVSETSEAAYEQEMSRLVDLGYEPMGDLKVERNKEQRFNGGGNYWETLTASRYTREVRLKRVR